ncbi:MAG: carboxypeptidase-like regulatory domain-containing protein [Bacteroidales bacterium]|nr:carboxypeptidase-like regulatory domain-containing protein [Bacteroidales bacterium]
MRFLTVLVLLILFYPICLWAQQGEYIEGKVSEATESNDGSPLIGANIYWLNTSIGATTGINGDFRLKKISSTSILVISFVGYQNDTIDVNGKDHVNVQLKASVELEEVEVIYRQKSTEISHLDPIKFEIIGEDELLKAACCNLSESFETNPSVDVSFTDAVTGTRQIQMLGLAGPYTQIMRENMPDIRGLSAIYGLTYVPGTWIESIQLNKGTGSVVNGYESLAGQINVELRKPEEADRLYLNTYGNQEGRVEVNTAFARRFDDGK